MSSDANKVDISDSSLKNMINPSEKAELKDISETWSPPPKPVNPDHAQTFTEFTQDTTFHGVKYIFASQHKARR